MIDFKKEQEYEREWWGSCANTYGEETKQISYANRMNLLPRETSGYWPVYDGYNKTIIDIGGGPTSMLLKHQNLKQGIVVDPCDYPTWVAERYLEANIVYLKFTGETDLKLKADEVWIYNCLQHTIDPEQIIKNAKSYAPVIRLFEWVGTGVVEGHPHDLKASDLNEWLEGKGKVEPINENGCYGICYYGVFSGWDSERKSSPEQIDLSSFEKQYFDLFQGDQEYLLTLD